MWGNKARRLAPALVVCATVGMNAGPGTAPAGDDAVLAQAAAVASAHWPSSRCRGKESVVWTPQAQLDAAHPGEGVAADASAKDCDVRLSEAARHWSGPMICALLEHEFGHLAGRAHTSDPTDVMHGGKVPWTHDCTRAFPPRRARSPRWRCELVRGDDLVLLWDCRRVRRR
jgi:hypothetical protein